MSKQIIIAGYLLSLAAVTFWISWFLMPDPGTTDTEHILRIVKEQRDSVFNSVVVQIVSSVLYLVALFFLLQKSFEKTRINIAGIILLGIGAMGLCADAFFHLLAFYMTDRSVNIQQDIIAVMDFMQKDALVFLVPLLLPLFFGSLLLSINLTKQEFISRIPVWVIGSAFMIGIGNAIANRSGLIEGGIPMIVVLGIFALGQVIAGLELMSASKRLKYAGIAENNF
jgi:hypothetical protein